MTFSYRIGLCCCYCYENLRYAIGLNRYVNIDIYARVNSYNAANNSAQGDTGCRLNIESADSKVAKMLA